MALELKIKPTDTQIKNAKEFYDFYIGVDEGKASFYKDLMELNGADSKYKASAKTIKEVPVKKVIPANKTIPLRQRTPKNGFAQTIAEIIEEILIEQDKPLTVKQLVLLTNEKGRNIIDLKNFSSQLIGISKSKNRFIKEKNNNRNYWGLTEWTNGIGFKHAYQEKMSK